MSPGASLELLINLIKNQRGEFESSRALDAETPGTDATNSLDLHLRAGRRPCGGCISSGDEWPLPAFAGQPFTPKPNRISNRQLRRHRHDFVAGRLPAEFLLP